MRLLPRRVFSQLRTRLRGRLPVWHSPSYRLPLTGLESRVGMEPRRADFVAFWLRDSGAIRARDLRSPRPISFEDLDRVHGLDLLESLGRPEALARIYAVDPSDVPVDEVLATVRLACGGTLAATREALETRAPTLNLLGGFHHAFPDKAGGFCPVNDIAVALAAVRAEGFRGRAVVLDLDAHPPDGTAACLEEDPDCWIGSLSASDWGALARCDETVLPEGTGDDEYLAALAALLQRMPRPGLAFVIAGGDVLAGDRFGRLALTLAGARRRDLEIAAALGGVASVWLPGGGYHDDAWKVLAATGTALATGSEAPIPARYDPLARRFAGIMAELSPAKLGEPEFTAADLEEALGLGSAAPPKALLGYYTEAGIEHSLYRYGVLAFLQRIGYGPFRVTLDRANPGDRARLYGEANGEEHVLVELVLQKRRIAGHDVLYVHWLHMRNPLARFSDARPRLPGQEVPGLGLAREMGELLALIARRLDLAAVVFRPAHFHTAFPARHNFTFVDPARQGRFEAMVRDLAGVPLLEVTTAAAEGRILVNGEPYAWEADEMALWLDPAQPTPRELVEAEAARVRFEIAPADAAGGGALTPRAAPPPGAAAPSPSVPSTPRGRSG